MSYAERLKSLTPEEMTILKEKAVVFFNRNGVPKKMEEALNAMFVDSPQDVYGYLVHFFRKSCPPPIIEVISCRPTFSSNGDITTLLELKGKFSATSEVYATVTVPSFVAIDTHVDHTSEYNAARNFVNDVLPTIIPPSCELLSAFNSGDMDRYIYDYFRNKEREVEENWRREKLAEQVAAPSESTVTAPGKKERAKATAKARPTQPTVELPPRPAGISVVSALSKLTCLAASHASQKPAFELIKESLASNGLKQRTNILPLSVVSQNGRTASGKLKCCKEVFVIINPCRLPDMILADISKIFELYRTKAFAKAPAGTARLITELGSVSPAMDRPEQLLDTLIEACNECGLRVGTDVLFGINCAAHELFDQDKGKYELIVGGARTPEDAADFWADLVARYPVAILIDPLRKEDPAAWQRLGDKIAGKCFLFADHSMGARLDHLAMGEVPDRAQSTIPEVLQPSQPLPAVPEVAGGKSRRPSTSNTVMTVGTAVTAGTAIYGPPISIIPPCASGVILRMDGTNLMTLTAATKLAMHLQENNYMMMVTASPTDGSDTYAVDLALGLKAHSLLVGGIGRGERAALVSKWHSYSSTYDLDTPSPSSVVPADRASLFTCQKE